jgi:hypothetical protein
MLFGHPSIGTEFSPDRSNKKLRVVSMHFRSGSSGSECPVRSRSLDRIDSAKAVTTHGYTEAVLGLTHLLGFSFAPHINKLGKQTLYIFHTKKRSSSDWKISPNQTINTNLMRENWVSVGVITSGHAPMACAIA